MLHLDLLTHREVEVLYLIASGYSSKLVAHKLRMSVRTAEKHAENIIAKLRATNAPGAVTISIKAKIIDPDKVDVLQTPPSL